MGFVLSFVINNLAVSLRSAFAESVKDISIVTVGLDVC